MILDVVVCATGSASAVVCREEENTGRASATHADARLLCVPLALPVLLSMAATGNTGEASATR